MGLYVVLGALAAFGLLCALWVVFGGLLTGASLRGLCFCSSLEEGLAAARRWRWLWNAGVVSLPLILVDQGLPPADREILQGIGPWIEICDGNSFPLWELERIKRD